MGMTWKPHTTLTGLQNVAAIWETCWLPQTLNIESPYDHLYLVPVTRVHQHMGCSQSNILAPPDESPSRSQDDIDQYTPNEEASKDKYNACNKASRLWKQKQKQKTERVHIWISMGFVVSWETQDIWTRITDKENEWHLESLQRNFAESQSCGWF